MVQQQAAIEALRRGVTALSQPRPHPPQQQPPQQPLQATAGTGLSLTPGGGMLHAAVTEPTTPRMLFRPAGEPLEPPCSPWNICACTLHSQLASGRLAAMQTVWQLVSAGLATHSSCT